MQLFRLILTVDGTWMILSNGVQWGNQTWNSEDEARNNMTAIIGRINREEG